MVMSMEIHSEQASTPMDKKDALACAAENELVEVSDTATVISLQCELEQLRHDYDTLHARMVNAESLIREHREENEELKRSRLALSEEIMDLTKALFEEANGMVAEEAKARASLEMARRKLEGELESTKEALRLEKQQLLELRDRIHAHRFPHASGDEGGGWRFSKDKFIALLSEHSHKYFPVLLPQLRFSSRPRYDTAAGPIWDRISESIDAGGCLREFSRFVERLPEMDADALLTHSFLRRLCETEVMPCLNFDLKPRPYVKKLILALLKNTCCIEKIVIRSTPVGDAHGDQSVRSGGSSEASDLGVIADLQMLDIDLSLNCPAEGEETNGTGGSPLIMGERLRGIMNHFTMSVSSLPETLLNGHNPALTGSSTNGSPTSSPSSPPVCKYCSLCGRSSDVPKYRFRLTDIDSWSAIDKVCRQRLVAVGHFFTFIRHLRGGLYANRPLLDLYYDLLHYLRLMFYARLDRSATLFFLQSDYEAYLDLIEAHVETEGSQVAKAKVGHSEGGEIDQGGGKAIGGTQDTVQICLDISSEDQVPFGQPSEGEECDRAITTQDVE